MPIAAIGERGGKILSLVTAEMTAVNLGRVLAENIARESHPMTDRFSVYAGTQMKEPFRRTHHDRPLKR
jgi:hypothetical protein